MSLHYDETENECEPPNPPLIVALFMADLPMFERLESEEE